MPNVVVTSDGDSQNGDTVYINGFAQNLINWTLDGVPLNDNDSYAFYTNEFIPTRLIAGTRYYPGAASAAIPGLAAFGGSVETYSLNPGPTPSASLFGGYGSFGKYNAGLLVNSGLLGANTGAPTALWFYANKNHSDGYFDNTPSDQKQYLFKSVTQLGRGALTLFYTQNNQKFNYFGGCNKADLATYGDTCNVYRGDPVVNGKQNGLSPAYNFNQYQNWLSYAKYEGTFGGVTISNQLYSYRGNGYGGGAYTNSSYNLLQPNGVYGSVKAPVGGLFMSHGINDTRRWGNIFRLAAPLSDSLGLEAGLWFNKNDTTHDQQFISSVSGQYLGSVYDEPVVTKLYEPYVNLTWKPTSRLALQGGVKYLKADRDFIDYAAVAKSKGTAGQYSTSISATMPSLGVNYKVAQGVNVYANVTRNTNPQQYNQFYSGTFNPDLAAQKATTYDMGVIYALGAWSGAVDVFRVNFDDYIQNYKFTPPGGTAPITMLANVGKAVNEGIAWQNNFRLSKTWSAYANMGLLNAQFTSSNLPMPYAPHSTVAVGGIFHAGSWRASLGARHASRAYWTDSTSPIPAHTLVDASVRYTWHGGDTVHGLGLKTVSVGFNVNNLLDERYTVKYNTGYPGSASNPLIKTNLPRNYYLSLEAQF
ncbi:Fe(3+) dicitrate transport protein FecA precursor [mine drainage metagenome]|uniref:Fe(3+) dicitrate transport protein FecA n=1 Tax=mine drainage metagenome TaxID=410659 RepID=A0A1J5PYR1_9ZZZZ